MIISKTPYRISFFGGGSDYPEWFMKYNGEVISTTINKFVYISLRNLPDFWKHKYRISWSKIEEVKNVEQIKHKVVREVLKEYKFNNGLEIHYDGDLPARSGMGSSSSFVVGIMKAIHEYQNKKISNKNLALKSINFERNILKENVGSQDQVAVVYGGLNNIKFDKDGFKISKLNLSYNYLKNLNKSLLMVYTGISRFSDDISSTFTHNISNKKKQNLIKILNHVSIAKKMLKNQLLDEFGMLLHESWATKKELSSSITNYRINMIYEEGIKAGSLGGKLLGAGGGGFLLFYVPKNSIEKFKHNMKKYTIIPFEFSDKGSEIILNTESTND